MARRERQISKRVNFFDGQRVTESDLDSEQLHKITSISEGNIDFHGSGVVKNSPFEEIILLNTSLPNSYITGAIANPSKDEIEAGNYDGKGITLDRQPSDANNGSRLTFEMNEVDIAGRNHPKIMILGWAFDGTGSSGELVAEFIEFKENEVKLSKYYYTKVVAIFFNNFSGGTGRTALSPSKISLDLTSSGGYLVVKEADPMSVFSYTTMSFQNESPNVDMRDFITSDITKTIQDEIEEALGASQSISDLYVELGGRESISFNQDGSTSIAYGQKFLSRSNNIQKIDLLLSVEEDSTAVSGHEFDWSGELVIAIYALATETKCATDSVPDDLINFDPETTPIIEMSYGQQDLEDLGYIFDDSPQKVSFNFSGTLIADPNIDPSIEEDKYYALLVSRSGDNRTGTINLEKGYDKVYKKGEDNVPLTTVEQYAKQESKFFEFDPALDRYSDDSNSSLWYEIHSNGIEVVNGTAYSDDGLAITIEKTEEFVGGSLISKFERNIPLATVAEGSRNYVILTRADEFITPHTHPRTGNRVFTRIKDAPSVSVVDSTGLADVIEDTIPIILARVTDKNVRDAQAITGTFTRPGEVDIDTILIVNPSNEILNSNLINRIITPDTGCHCNSNYRIVDVICSKVKTGDLDRDGKLTNSDITELLDIVGNTINSDTTERSIIGGTLDLSDFLLADLNADETVDGTDIELLEDAIDGYVNFAAGEEQTLLYLILENILESDDNPVIVETRNVSGITTSGTNTMSFLAPTEDVPLTIRVGDAIEIKSGSLDAGNYIISNKSISGDNLTVTLTVTDTSGSTVTFIGDVGFDVIITSSSDINIYADNPGLIDIPFAGTNYEISFIEAPFESRFVDVCDLRRFVPIRFIEEIQQNNCLCTEDGCVSEDTCDPIYKTQTYVPGDIYLPSGELLSSPGIPYHGDFEYTTITVPIPPGTITDCGINLYTNFVKAEDHSCKTASGYTAMKFSDGTYVGCGDSGSDTDITKGRVKFTSAIASLYVDALVDGYSVDGYADTEATVENSEIITENFVDYTYDGFSTWTFDPSNDLSITSISNPAGSNQPAVFGLTTSTNTAPKFGKLNIPSAADNFADDFIIDFKATRTAWPHSSLTSGSVIFGSELVITNPDGSSALLFLGWKSQGGTSAASLVFTGNIKNPVGVTISTFDYSIDAPESIGTEVLFRLRRVNDVVFAYYAIPDSISQVTFPFGQYTRIGSNPSIQPGSGTATLNLSILQVSAPNAGVSFFGRISEAIIRSEYSSNTAPTISPIGRSFITKEIDRAAFTFPLNISSRTNLVSATLTLTSQTTGTITDTFNVIPLDILNADNLGGIYNYPTNQDTSLIASFVPGAIVSGGDIEVDLTSMFLSFLSETSHLPGYLKGIIVEPDISATSTFDVSTTADLVIGYEDITTGVVFKVGISIDPTTGIATLNTRNILYDSLIEENRTVVKFGVFLKKAGFANDDVSITIDELTKIGVGTCQDEDVLDDSDECYFIVGSTGVAGTGTAVGTFVQGPFPCIYLLP